MLKSIYTVFAHEFRDFIRDRRTLKTMVILLCFMPILFSYIVGNVGELAQKGREDVKRVGYLESDSVRTVLPFLQQQGLEMVPVKERNKEVFRTAKIDALLAETTKDELDSIDEVSTNLDIWTSGASKKAESTSRRVEALLHSYSQTLGKRQLILRGVAPLLSDPFQITVKSLEDDESLGFATLDLLVTLLGMGLFYSTLHLAVDTTAGERERLTLESLFYTAAPRAALVFGKWLLVTFIVFFGTWFVGTIFWGLGEFAIFQRMLGRTETFAYTKLLVGLLIFFPLCPMVASLQIMIGSLSSSVKQAQTFNGISGMLTLPLSFLTLLDTIKPLLWVPITGQGLAFSKFLHGEEVDWKALAVTETATLGLAAVMLILILHRFHQERMIVTHS